MALQGKVSIFVVEDDDAWAATLTAALSKLNYSVTHFSSGEAALEKLGELNPQVIVQDIDLDFGGGKLNGIDTLKRVKEIKPETYVVMFSAQNEIDTALKAFDNGAFDYVMKPSPEAMHRLELILRNIENQIQLKGKLTELRISVRRDRFWVMVLVLFCVVLSLVIFLKTCPDTRDVPIRWDPLGVGELKRCRGVVGSDSTAQPGTALPPNDSMPTSAAGIELEEPAANMPTSAAGIDTVTTP
jgi:CheY-like chemotaxis protein